MRLYKGEQLIDGDESDDDDQSNNTQIVIIKAHFEMSQKWPDGKIVWDFGISIVMLHGL